MRKIDEERGVPGSVLKNIPDDEPIFILRAQDILAPETIRSWADNLVRYADDGVEPVMGHIRDKADNAYRLADAMEKWPNRKLPD